MNILSYLILQIFARFTRPCVLFEHVLFHRVFEVKTQMENDKVCTDKFAFCPQVANILCLLSKAQTTFYWIRKFDVYLFRSLTSLQLFNTKKI